MASPVLGFDELVAGFVDPAALNLQLAWIEKLAAKVLQDYDVTSPTNWEIEGNLVAVASAGTSGAFVGNENKLALFINGDWDYRDIPDSTLWMSEEGNHAVTGTPPGQGPWRLILRDNGGTNSPHWQSIQSISDS